jgi:pilus assembly protein CpaE
MPQTLRVILFTAETESAPELRRTITSLSHIRIVAELDEPSLIGQAAAQFPAELLIADLDPSSQSVLESIRQLKDAVPGLPVLAVSRNIEGDVVLRAMKAGVREFLLKPLNLEEFQQSVATLAGGLAKSQQPGKLISVIGSGGGVGCTTIATNLAVELAELTGAAGGQQKVALVDLDFRFGHVATLLDVHGPFTVADLCATPEHLDPEMVMKALIRHDSGLYVLRRPELFSQAESITAAHCANVLASLQEMCAYVVVDGPTRHDPGGRSVLDAADHIFLVLQLLVTSVRNADRMIRELAAQGFNPERVSFVVNRLGRESAHLEVDQVEAILKSKVCATLRDDWKSVSCSINIGRPLKAEFDRSGVRLDIQALAQRVHEPEGACVESPKGPGLWGKVLQRFQRSPRPPAPEAASAVPLAVGMRN